MTKHQAPEVTSEQPLPCPFCDTDKVVVRDNTGPKICSAAHAWVACLLCATEGPEKDSVAEAITAWNTRATQPQSLTIDDETVERVAKAIRFAINPLDGDPIGVMIHNYEFLQADGIDAQIALVDEVCAVMARAALAAPKHGEVG